MKNKERIQQSMCRLTSAIINSNEIFVINQKLIIDAADDLYNLAKEQIPIEKPQLIVSTVNNSLSLENIVDTLTNKDISVHNKICKLWFKSGNKKEDFPKLPPCWMNVEITLKNKKKYKSFLASINNRGGVQFVINQRLKEREYLEVEEIIKWEFI